MTCFLAFMFLVYGGHEDAPQWVKSWAWVILPLLLTAGCAEAVYFDIPHLLEPFVKWAKT